MKTIIVDKIEKDVISCEDFFTGDILEIKTQDVVENVKEGDVLTINENNLKYSIDLEKTIKRKIEIKMKLDSIWNNEE